MIPVTGLSLHKPSPLWPPPPYDISNRVHKGLRNSIKDVLHRHPRSESTKTPQAARPIGSDTEVSNPETLPTEPGPVGVVSTASLPVSDILEADQSVPLQTATEATEVAQQIQLYAPNDLLKHPLVSPALSYLGGLPPLLFIAGDREVLRDEIIYACVLFPLTPWFVVTHHRRLRRAHRAAHPERFPLSDEIKKLYPAFKLGETSMQPTPVHLQVYDGIFVLSNMLSTLSKCFSFIIMIDVGHVLPILFPFTTPGKYCYRAVASFVEQVTKPPQVPVTSQGEIQSPQVSSRPNLYRSLTTGISRAACNIKRRSSLAANPPMWKTSGQAVVTSNGSSPSTSGFVTPQGQNLSVVSLDASGSGTGGSSEDQAHAGEAKVYESNWVNISSLNLFSY